MNIQYKIDNAAAAMIMLGNIDMEDEDILLIDGDKDLLVIFDASISKNGHIKVKVTDTDGDKEHFKNINIAKLVYDIIKEITDNDSENYS